MFQVLSKGIVIFSLGIAPLLLLMSWVHKKKYHNIILSWKKPVMVIPTIACFSINLTLFILSVFFFAIYFGKIEGIKIFDYTPERIYLLGVYSLLAIGGTTFTYLALQNYFTQFITTEGIVLRRWSWEQLRFIETNLLWEQINDYYVKFDYPVSIFTFIILQEQGLERVTLSVPFYALSRFEQHLEAQMDFIQFQREKFNELSGKYNS